MKNIIIALVVGVLLVGGVYYSVSQKEPSPPVADKANVKVIDGKQIIEIDVKGGYSPKRSEATAGIPTILRFKTKGTFDCSASLSLPSLGINQVLPNTGSTDFDIGSPAPGLFEGRCSMGMYFFSIDFK